ncbi:MAG: hypothetical protein HY433_03280 [Candidatus Liptonbacteria bacterium]|nr:hypothetical protein [Candidatus Liptonbacteria bacterium]
MATFCEDGRPRDRWLDVEIVRIINVEHEVRPIAHFVLVAEVSGVSIVATLLTVHLDKRYEVVEVSAIPWSGLRRDQDVYASRGQAFVKGVGVVVCREPFCHELFDLEVE